MWDNDPFRRPRVGCECIVASDLRVNCTIRPNAAIFPSEKFVFSTWQRSLHWHARKLLQKGPHRRTRWKIATRGIPLTHGAFGVAGQENRGARQDTQLEHFA